MQINDVCVPLDTFQDINVPLCQKSKNQPLYIIEKIEKGRILESAFRDSPVETDWMKLSRRRNACHTRNTRNTRSTRVSATFKLNWVRKERCPLNGGLS